MSHKLRQLLLCLLALTTLSLSPQLSADSTRIELIQLQGRTAEELIPLLKPVVAPGGALSGSGYRLIVRASEAQHAEIKRLLTELDQAPRRLLITVHMGELSQAEQQQRSLQVDKQAGDVSAGIGLPPVSGRGVYIGRQDSARGITYQRHNTRSLSDASNRQQLRTTEGYPSYIATGLDYPYPSHIESWQGPHGSQGGSIGYDYKPVRSGFYALVRVRGDQAVVEISPRKESLSSKYQGAVDVQQVSTTVSGPLGGWIRIGETGSSATDRQRQSGRSASTQTLQTQPLWLRVEVSP